MASTTYTLVTADDTASRPKPKRRLQLAPYLFLVIPLAIYLTFIIGPTIATGYLSLTRWDGITDPVFKGFQENFSRLFDFSKEPLLPLALGNNIKWLLFFLVVPTSMGLGLAMLFNGNFPGARIFKIAFYSPLVLASVVVGLIWSSMYNPSYGLINGVLRALGMTTPPVWLADRGLVIWCIIFAASWRQVGYVMILYLAGLKGLDSTLLEAAVVDGASPWQRFYMVIFPLLAPITVVVMVISVIDSLRSFDLVSIMTNGGPNHASEVLANFMYNQAFTGYNMGYAAAIAVTLFALMLCFIVPYLIYTARTELEY